MKKGFTLVELLIVVLIIGILSAVALPQYQKAVEKTRYAGMMPLAASVKTAQEAFYLADSSYSPSLEYLDVRVPGEVHCEALSSSESIEYPADDWARLVLENRSYLDLKVSSVSNPSTGCSSVSCANDCLSDGTCSVTSIWFDVTGNINGEEYSNRLNLENHSHWPMWD
ncbi:MAG: pilin [Elusimicrobiaceae bacterium]|nr:pilin [Elusimicrobiaceae bacterium]